MTRRNSLGSVFQFTPLREGRRELPFSSSVSRPFQFTPLREGRPLPAALESRHSISIHAPPRGATMRLQRGWGDDNISIHAPPRGATESDIARLMQSIFQFTPLREGRPQSATRWHRRILFQFTPLREGRRAQMDGHAGNQVISIHAPPRGATR